MIRRIELLAPAKNKECAIAAVNHGADAVYMGASRYGARAAAGNLPEDIACVIRYAHLYDVKVFITLNTLLKDSELKDAVRLSHTLYQMGADALIIQDIRLMYLRREGIMPPIPLHASTQMDNSSREQVLQRERDGFERVVLARELNIEEMSEIREQTSVSLESFVHGALCVSYSGRCYISQVDCGRSANRGECAQYCRLPYDLEDSQGRTLMHDRHLLSLKDMDRSSYLKEMIDAGIDSFKIEGRLKDVAYVKNITAYYRQKLDRITGNKSSSGSCTFFFIPNSEKTFHRDKTDYLTVHGHMDKPVAQWYTPKSTGEYIGRIGRIYPDGFEIVPADRLKKEGGLHNGDGLCYISPDGTFEGFRVDIAKGMRVFKQGKIWQPGMDLFRNLDYAFEQQLKGKTAGRNLRLDITLEALDNGKGLHLVLNREAPEGEAPVRAEVTAQIPLQPAKDLIQVRYTLTDTLSKLGGTCYRAGNIRFIPDDFPWFAPVSAIADLRRSAVNLLEDKVYERYARPVIDAGKLISLIDPDKYPGMLSADSLPAEGTPLMTCKYCIKYELGACPRKHGSKAVLLQEPLYLKTRNKRFRLYFDCKSCRMLVGIDSSSNLERPQASRK